MIGDRITTARIDRTGISSRGVNLRLTGDKLRGQVGGQRVDLEMHAERIRGHIGTLEVSLEVGRSGTRPQDHRAIRRPCGIGRFDSGGGHRRVGTMPLRSQVSEDRVRRAGRLRRTTRGGTSPHPRSADRKRRRGAGSVVHGAAGQVNSNRADVGAQAASGGEGDSGSSVGTNDQDRLHSEASRAQLVPGALTRWHSLAKIARGALASRSEGARSITGGSLPPSSQIT